MGTSAIEAPWGKRVGRIVYTGSVGALGILREGLGTEATQVTLHLNAPWEYKLLDLYYAPAVTAAAERRAWNTASLRSAKCANLVWTDLEEENRWRSSSVS